MLKRVVKIFVAIITFVLIMLLGYYFDIRLQGETLQALQAQEVQLQKQVAAQKNNAQENDAHQQYALQLQRLLQKSQVPALLEEISTVGHALGLEFQIIRLLPEKELAFYHELPIEISVVGDYHQLAIFSHRIATLFYLVTLEDFVMRPMEPGNAKRLLMGVRAKTYYTQRQASENLPSIDASFDYPHSNARNPFLPFASAKTGNHLQSVGTIEKNGRKWVLTKAPKGVKYHEENMAASHHRDKELG